MPGRDIMGKWQESSLNIAPLKPHKTLPRSRTHKSDQKLPNPLAQKPSQVHAAEALSARSSERIRSWIQEPFSTHAALDRELPLTPPIILMDMEDENWMDGPPISDYASVAQQNSSDTQLTTPLVHQSPPTPDTTPPRASHAASLPLAPRDPSLRTGSFETAREHPLSDGDHTSIDSSSLHPARQKWLKNPGNVMGKSVGFGLGLGLELEEEENTASTRSNLRNMPKAKPLMSANELRQATRVGTELNDAVLEEGSLVGIQLQPKLTRTRARTSTHPKPSSGMMGEDAESPVVRSQSLRQRLEKAQRHPSPSTEKFAEEIEWPLDDDGLDLDAKLREIDNRRFSQISATSTVVEAMVIDAKPRRKQTLRHTGKVSDFKSESPRTNPSNSGSIMLDHLSRRRLPRHSISPDRGRRRTVATDASGSTAATLERTQESGILVISPFSNDHFEAVSSLTPL